MAGVLVEARMPGLRDGDPRRRHRQVEIPNLQSEADRAGGDRKRHRGDDIGTGGCEHGGVEPGNDKPHRTRQAQRGERIVDRAVAEPPPRCAHMHRRGEAARGDGTLQQRMSAANHGDETIVQQRLLANFRPDAAEDADIEVDAPLAEGGDIL